MDFAGFIKAVADSGVRPDEQAAILKAFLSFRDAAKVDYDNILAKHQEQRAYYLSRLGDTERLAIDLRNQLASARVYGQVVHRDCVDANKRVNELERENEQLKAALAEARAQLPAKVTINLGEICRTAHDRKDRVINFIKQVRNSDDLIVQSNGNKAGLVFAKEVCLAVSAYKGTGWNVPCQHDPGTSITSATPYPKLRREINYLAMKEYPNHQIAILDD